MKLSKAVAFGEDTKMPEVIIGSLYPLHLHILCQSWEAVSVP